MANPTPKALHDAAATLRSEAAAARQTIDEDARRRDNENQTALAKAADRTDVAELTLKNAQSRADEAFKQENDLRTQSHDQQRQAQEAAQRGDVAKANELNRQAGDSAARSDDAAARSAQAQREVVDANVAVAESHRALSEEAGELRSRMVDPMEADRQLGLMEDKAKLLDEAGSKLALAATIDNPVERAGMELDAEKMLRNASGIQIITSDITKVTGQSMQLPDIDALPTQTTPIDDTSLMDPNADDSAATGTSMSGTPDKLDDPVGMAASAGGGTQDPTNPSAGISTDAIAAAPLVDPLGVDLGAGTGSGAAFDSAQPAATDSTARLDSAQPVDAALATVGGAAPLDDPLGVDLGAGTGSGAAFESAQPAATDSTAALDSSQPPDAAPTVGAFTPESDVASTDFGSDGTDAATSPTTFDAPDPTADLNAFAADPAADISSAAPIDNSGVDDLSV